MLTRKDFWIGLALGVVLYYIYANHLKGSGGA